MDKKYLKAVAASVLTVIVCIGVIAYLGYHFFGSSSSDVEVVAADSVTMEEKSEYTAYILRSETLLTASSNGGVSYQYANGAKVSRNSVVARLYSGDDGDQVRAELVNYDNKISILSRSNVDEGTRFIGTTIIDSDISSTYTKIMRKMSEGDVDYALQLKDELNILLNRRKVLVGTLTGYDEQSNEYSKQEQALIAGLGDAYTEIKATESGYFYTEIDGYETVFDAANADTMTIEDYDRMLDTDPVEQINNGYAIGKLVTEFKWYITFEINVEDMKKYTVQSSYEVVFPYNSDERINMTLERMITPIDGSRCVLVLSTSEAPQNFNYLRAQTVQIVESSYTGYRVPSSAVRVIDGVRGVYILGGSVVRFRRITPLAEGDGYIIAKKQDTLDDESVAYDLGYCDLIITKGKNLYDGKIIE